MRERWRGFGWGWVELLTLGTGGHIADGMASVYLRKKSRFWWVKFRDPATGLVRRQSTGIDQRAVDGRRKAKRIEAEHTQREMAAPAVAEPERWEAWAADYFARRYAGAKGSVLSAKYGLIDLMAYFRERGLRTPRMVTYADAEGFVPWRVSGETLRAVGHNTAVLRFVFFRVLMAEAVRRGFAPGNPCREVELRKRPPKEKAEITAGDEVKILAALEREPRWMGEQFLVLMRQGCRLTETLVPLDRIDTERRKITFRLKGGKLHTAALHPELLPLIERARLEKRATLIEPAPSAGAAWCNFFAKLGLPYSAHCARVTVVTRLLRAGHSTAKVCAFIGHTELVNRIYRRLNSSDADDLLNTLCSVGPSPSPSAGSSRRRKKGRATKP